MQDYKFLDKKDLQMQTSVKIYKTTSMAACSCFMVVLMNNNIKMILFS